MRRCVRNIFLLFFLIGVFSLLPNGVLAQKECLEYSDTCIDDYGGSLGECCEGLECNQPVTGYGYLTECGYAPTPTPTPPGYVSPTPTPSPTPFPPYATPTTIAGTYRCKIAGIDNVCVQDILYPCPAHCVPSIPCSSLDDTACWDAGPLPCDCSQQLDLPRLYGIIQSKGGMFSFLSGLSIGGVISPLLTLLFPIAGLIFLLMFIYGGYNFMLSAGDPKKAQAARGIITTAAIGFIIVFTAYWIVQLIGNILGLGDITGIF